MILHIFLTSHKARLELREKDEIKNSREFFVDNNLSNHLLSEIDTLLKDSNREPLSLEKVLFSAKDSGFTTERIGQTVTNAYNFSLKNKA